MQQKKKKLVNNYMYDARNLGANFTVYIGNKLRSIIFTSDTIHFWFTYRDLFTVIIS